MTVQISKNVKDQTWDQFNSAILELLIFLKMELKFATKTYNPQIYLLFNFLIQKYFFHDNSTWNINYSE